MILLGIEFDLPMLVFVVMAINDMVHGSCCGIFMTRIVVVDIP